MNTINAQGYNLPVIKVGDTVKLKGYRNPNNGKKALEVTVCEIIGINKTESRSPLDRFILKDQQREFYGFSRSEFRRIK